MISELIGHAHIGRHRISELVRADMKGTPEVHGEMYLNKYMRFQSVKLVGAVGIENTYLKL